MYNQRKLCTSILCHHCQVAPLLFTFPRRVFPKRSWSSKQPSFHHKFASLTFRALPAITAVSKIKCHSFPSVLCVLPVKISSHITLSPPTALHPLTHPSSLDPTAPLSSPLFCLQANFFSLLVIYMLSCRHIVFLCVVIRLVI